MARKRGGENPLAGYPAVFHDWTDGALRGEKPPDFKAGDTKAQATHARWKFNNFRRVLSDQGHPGAVAAYAFTLSLEERADGWWVVFKWDELRRMELVAKDAANPAEGGVIPSVTPAAGASFEMPAVEEKDEMEDMVKKFIRPKDEEGA